MSRDETGSGAPAAHPQLSATPRRRDAQDHIDPIPLRIKVQMPHWLVCVFWFLVVVVIVVFLVQRLGLDVGFGLNLGLD